jgi:hypothetical protein
VAPRPRHPSSFLGGRSTVGYTQNVIRALCLLLAATFLAWAVPPAYYSARRKLDLIEGDRAPAGAVYTFTKAEIEAWAAVEIPEQVPEGFRNATVELGNNVATGHALIDFMRLRHAKGAPKNWFLDKLLEGERPVAVAVEVSSANGSCTVFLRSLQISGVAATGSVLDFLVKTFFLSLFPDAKINEPFRMDHRVDRVAVRANAVYVKINQTPPPPGPAKPVPKPRFGSPPH